MGSMNPDILFSFMYVTILEWSSIVFGKMRMNSPAGLAWNLVLFSGPAILLSMSLKLLVLTIVMCLTLISLGVEFCVLIVELSLSVVSFSDSNLL
jgi:hypothetical protein